MADLILERKLGAPIDRVFQFVTQPENLTQWWGPEGMTVPEGNLDFSRLGPWDSVMMDSEGQKYKVSGTVTAINAPTLVSFTWAWHDENDQRGHESRVTIELIEQSGGTLFRLTHAGLADEESSKNHEQGWNSTLNKLERMAA